MRYVLQLPELKEVLYLKSTSTGSKTKLDRRITVFIHIWVLICWLRLLLFFNFFHDTVVLEVSAFFSSLYKPELKYLYTCTKNHVSATYLHITPSKAENFQQADGFSELCGIILVLRTYLSAWLCVASVLLQADNLVLDDAASTSVTKNIMKFRKTERRLLREVMEYAQHKLEMLASSQ